MVVVVGGIDIQDELAKWWEEGGDIKQRQQTKQRAAEVILDRSSHSSGEAEALEASCKSQVAS